MSEHPRISFVIAARLGEHDDSFLGRLRTTLRILDALVTRHHLSCEFIIVQYNPPSGKPRIEDALKDMSLKAFPIRIITVPPAAHAQLAPPSRTGVFAEFIAKNIGIRRAQGEYVLVTNLDIIFSNEMIARLAQPLDRGTFYRANRRDLNIYAISETLNADQALALCHTCTDRIWTEYGLLYTSWQRWLKRFLKRPGLKNIFMAPIFNPLKKITSAKFVHDGAAGDFLLAHRDVWYEVHGYDQRQVYDLYLDSYILGILVCRGLKQIVLSQPIYHINHHQNPTRLGPDFEKFKRDMQSMAETGIPYYTYPEYWGFPDERFEENLLGR
jgi:hypothetical protein